MSKLTKFWIAIFILCGVLAANGFYEYHGKLSHKIAIIEARQMFFKVEYDKQVKANLELAKLYKQEKQRKRQPSVRMG